MKRLIKIILPVCFCLVITYFFSGCKENKATNNSEENTSDSNIISYCAKEKTDENQIYFNYPQINDTTHVSEKINDLIVEFVKEELEKREFNCNIKDFPEDWEWNNDEYTRTAMKTDYKITRNDSEYFSVTFEGLLNYRHAAHPIHYFNSLIIDVQNCKLITLSDLNEIDDEFIKLIQNTLLKKSTQVLAEKFGCDPEDIPKEVGRYSIEHLTETLQNSNSGFHFFLTDTALGISIPVQYAIGDHYEVMIDYEELNSFDYKTVTFE